MNMSRLALNSFSRLLSLETSFGSLRLCGQPRYFSESSTRKPPPTAFLLFYHSKLPEIKELHKDSPNKVTHWSKTAGSMWKELNENDKNYYRDLFQKRRIQYLATVTEDEIISRKKSISEKKVKIEKRRHRQEAKNLNKPKRPPTAHGLYVQEQTGSLQTSPSDMKSVFSRLSREWKDLSESEKERFIKDAREKREHHEKELCAWEDEQIANNRKHLVRITRLKGLNIIAKPRKETKMKAKKVVLRNGAKAKEFGASANRKKITKAKPLPKKSTSAKKNTESKSKEAA